MDRFDRAILRLMQEDAQIPMAKLAERVGLSAPACYRRVRALRESGAIQREIAVVAPKTMGWPISMIVLVTLERDRGHIVDEVVARLRRTPEVIDIWSVTGDHDLVLHMIARDMEAYNRVTRETLHAEEHVRSFQTLVVLQQPKRMAPIPDGLSS
ncbi:Lrp/AsnC family transcriptional regulator [Terrihabitans sp. B22-R8]|uniref:Lrp/AsnC family transcriptional regulator n=1 Tax=Terrihabitans sp. B22-R8 TaxID=3425128 RepID=UPI00403C29B6